jgi:hypothetical protein
VVEVVAGIVVVDEVVGAVVVEVVRIEVVVIMIAGIPELAVVFCVLFVWFVADVEDAKIAILL